MEADGGGAEEVVEDVEGEEGGEAVCVGGMGGWAGKCVGLVFLGSGGVCCGAARLLSFLFVVFMHVVRCGAARLFSFLFVVLLLHVPQEEDHLEAVLLQGAVDGAQQAVAVGPSLHLRESMP